MKKLFLTLLALAALNRLPAETPPSVTTTSVTNTVTTVSNNVTTTVITITTTTVSAALAGGTNAVAAAPRAVPPLPVVPAPQPAWQSTATLGATVAKGNSDSVLLSVAVGSQKKTPKDEYDLGADASYGEQNSVESVDRLHAFAQANHLYSPRFYAYGRIDGLHDGIAGLAYQASLSPGAGYYFIKSSTTLLSGEVGPGVITERLGHASDTYATLRLGQKFERKFNSQVRFWESIEYLPEVDLWDKYSVNAELGVETAITKSFSLKTFLQDNYVNLPAAGRKDNDFKLVSGITYKF